MVNVLIDVTDLGGEARPGDKVVLWRPRMGGSATHAGRVISTAPVTVFLTDGKATVSDVEPGEMAVLLQCRGVESQGPVTVGVPDGNGTVTLRALLESQFTYSPPVVSAVQSAADAAANSERNAIKAQVRSEAAADRAEAKVDDAINNGADLVRNEVKQDADRAVSARQAAKTSETNAKSSETAAATSASNAKTSETNSKQHETNAGDYAAVATTAATEAVDAMESASDAATAIGDSVTAAAQHATKAEQHESGAAAYAQNASDAADRVGTAEQVGTWAQQAQDAADRIGTAETVEGWANSARDSASAAEQSASKAEEYRDAALSAASSTADELRGDLIDIAGEASSHATESSRSAARAKASETNAATHEANSLSAAERAEFAAEETIQQVEGDFATRNYADSKDWVKAGLSLSDDLNLFTDPGIRPILRGSIMASLESKPPGFNNPGYLEVIKAGQTITQRLTQAAPRGPETVERQTRQGAWGEWQTLGVSTRRMYYTDYNDLPEGDYDIWTYAQARDMANRPPVIPSSAFVSTRRIGDQRMYQKVVGTGVGGLSGKWERYKSQSGDWQEWVEVHTDVSRAEVEYLISRSTPGAVDTSKVVTIGDSQVGASYSWANLLADVSGLTVINNGVSGYTPDEALIHAGVRSVKTVEPATLPPAVDVQINPAEPPVVAGHRARVWVGKIGDTPVEFKYSNTDDAFFFRNISTSTVDVPTGATWVPDTAGATPDHRRIVWFGGNSIRASKSQPWETPAEHVMRAYSDALFAWGDTTIVCGYVPGHGDTGGRDAANEINTWLSRIAPKQFLDIRHRLQLAAPDILGRALTPSEQQDISNGYLPQGLYQSDLVHLTEEAHVRIAEIVAEFPHGASPQVSIRSKPSPVVSSTGAGSPEGKISAPVGSIYTDTAATNGAIRWIKTSGTGNTGWRVEYGDTGWRDITENLTYATSPGSRILIRRDNNLVTVSADAFQLEEEVPAYGDFLSIPAGFRTKWPFRQSGAYEAGALYTSTGGLYISTRSAMAPGSRRFYIQYVSNTNWPTSLPGTPA